MPNEKHDREHIAKWLRLHLTDQVGPITFAKLLNHFNNDIDQALAAGIDQLTSIGIKPKNAQRIVASRDKIDIDAQLDMAEKLGIKILTLQSDDYPLLLRKIYDPPPVLYVKGQLTSADNLAVAMVGSRSCGQYGHEQASRLSHLLAAAGFTIVSGLARGIDSAAHRGALAAQGRTIAVQGCGLSQTYPPENADLAERIIYNGAVISELPLGFEPLPGTFPSRNRIISGLSLASIIVEARPNSGALITARLAMEQNREVMAVPGRVDAPGSFGPHKLIKDGAVLVRGIDDILEALGQIGQTLTDHAADAAEKAQQTVEPTLFDIDQLHLTKTESAIFEHFNHQPIHTEHLISASRLTPAQIYATLTSLQLKGLVKQLPGGYYQKRSKT